MLDQPDKTTDAWRRHLKRRPVTPCPLQQNCRWQLQRYGSAIAIDCQEDSPRDMAPDAPIRIIDEYVLSHIWSGKGLSSEIQIELFAIKYSRLINFILIFIIN